MARTSPRDRLNHSTARSLAALLGTVPVAIAAGAALLELLPLEAPERYLVGYFSVFPIWVGLCLWVFLAPGARRAWLGLLAAGAVLGAALLLGPRSASGLGASRTAAASSSSVASSTATPSTAAASSIAAASSAP